MYNVYTIYVCKVSLSSGIHHDTWQFTQFLPQLHELIITAHIYTFSFEEIESLKLRIKFA